MTTQRNAVVAKPALFIGSSAEGLPVAKRFRDELSERLSPRLWTERGMFEPTRITLESLERALDRFPHALIVLSPDDITLSRKRRKRSPRDNVVFEFGLFIGRHSRDGVFFAVPDSPGLEVPSDIFGLTPVKYRVVDGVIDVSAACAEIVDALERRPRRGRRSSPFWDVLSDTIAVLYGVEPESGLRPHPRYRVSLHDLETAWDLTSFLGRRYPGKRVTPVAMTEGWQRRIQPEADLVVVGGFVTNAQFANNRERYERFFRLKMGRLCIVEGQRVHVPAFAAPRGCLPPDGTDPQSVEDFPTELTTRDFGFIFNGSLTVFGRHRRVVAIGGVKGNGTRGAAHYLCADRGGVDEQLEATLGDNDTLELAISVDVDSDAVNHVSPLSIRLNNELLMDAPSPSSRPCELGRPCQGCHFGVTPAAPRSYADLSPRALKARLKAIVFDLDDTLIDTFNSLIVPLELEAARAMITAGARETDATTLASTLLRIRRSNPGHLENELQRKELGVTSEVLAARNRLLTSVPLENLRLSPEVIQLLRRMRNEFELYLLTAGAPDFQNRKIDRLEIRKHFREVIVVGDSSPEAKARAIKNLAAERGFAKESVLVVGNRLDNEIIAGNTLDMPTVWVRHGEGSELEPARGCGQPDFVVRNVLELASLLWG